MKIPLLVYVLVTAHLIGDWWLQNDEMATKKSHDNWALTRHVLVVGFVLTACALLWAALAGVSAGNVLAYGAVNMVAHWVTDYVTSRRNAKAFPWRPVSLRDVPSGMNVFEVAGKGWMVPSDTGNRHRFFAGIGDDQWVHAITLFATAEWLLL